MKNLHKRTIYAYSIPALYEYRIKHGDTPWLKVGDTERLAKDRVAEQDKTAVPEDLVIHGEWEIDFKHRDYEIHKILKKQGVLRIRKKREWFECDVNDVSSAVNKLNKGVSRPFSYTMREEQDEAVTKAYNYFINGGEEFLFNCKMRFGKTFAAYQLAKRLGERKTLILTYKPGVVDGWREDLNGHVDFNGFEFFHALDFSKENPINFNTNLNVILFASFQDILGKDLNGNVKGKWKDVISEHYDLVIIDEVHFGAETQKAKDIMKSLSYDYRLVMSGTPIKLLQDGAYTEENTYTWSYNDEQRKRQIEKNNGWRSTIYRWLPPMKLYAYSIGKDVEELVEYFGEDEFLTLNKFFSSEDGVTLNNAKAVEKWLDLLAAKSKRVFNSPFNNDKFTGKLNHTFWYVSGINHAKALAIAFRKHWYFKQYKVVVAAGDNEGEGNDTLDMVREAILRNPKTITLSCGKLNTGVTIREWDAVFMLSDTKAPETYWQTAFRVQSFFPDVKEECFVFDFNPNRMLKMSYDYAEILADKNQKTTDSIREFLEVMEVFVYDDNEFVPVELERVIENGLDVKGAIEKFTSTRVVDSSNADEAVLSVLSCVKGLKNKTLTQEISESWMENGKSFATKKKKDMTPKEKNEYSRIVAKALAVTQQIPTFIYTTSEKEESIDDVMKTKEVTLFRDIVGITLEEFRMMVEIGFLKRQTLDRAVQALSLKNI